MRSPVIRLAVEMHRLSQWLHDADISPLISESLAPEWSGRVGGTGTATASSTTRLTHAEYQPRYLFNDVHLWGVGDTARPEAEPPKLG